VAAHDDVRDLQYLHGVLQRGREGAKRGGEERGRREGAKRGGEGGQGARGRERVGVGGEGEAAGGGAPAARRASTLTLALGTLTLGTLASPWHPSPWHPS
jgi:hypothetical protein